MAANSNFKIRTASPTRPDAPDQFARFDRDGFLIFESVLSPDALSRIRDSIAPLMDATPVAWSDCDGVRTRRISALFAQSPVFSELATHPLVLRYVEDELGDSALLSSCVATEMQPDEIGYGWRHDDAHIDIPRPRASYGVTVVWALDDMHADSGAIELIPESHWWCGEHPEDTLSTRGLADQHAADTEQERGVHPASVSVIMPAGSMLVMKGALWHRAGVNQTGRPQLSINSQYCPGWGRQRENPFLAMSLEDIARLSPRAQALMGYLVHPPCLGCVDGRHPKTALMSS